MNISDIQWIDKYAVDGCGRKGSLPDYDVRLSIHDFAKKPKLYLAFRNKGAEFANDAKHISVSKVMEERIYFKADEFGYAVIQAKAKANYPSITFRISKDTAQVMRGTWEKKFNLQYDEENGLYYIELRKGKK